MTDATDPPLSTLLSWVWLAMTIEIDNAVEATIGPTRAGRLFRISLAMWANGLRCIDDDGITVEELQRRAGAACNLGGLERWGWISVGDPSTARRPGFGTHRGIRTDTVVRPTRGGAFAQRVWPATIGEVEERWRTRFGIELVEPLRDAARVTGAPWAPAEVHSTDGFRTRVTGPDVRERMPDTDRPLVAILGGALVALTSDAEHDAAVSLPISMNLLRPVGDDLVRRRDLPQRAGVSKEAVAMALTFATRAGLLDTQADAICLTAAGRDALTEHERRRREHDDPALHDALWAVLSNRGALAAGLVPPPGCWRAERPYASQTSRMIADPTGTLPWHPMVLHRGGWPDGS